MSQYILQKDTPASKKGCIFIPVYGGEVYIGSEKPYESLNRIYVENNLEWFLKEGMEDKNKKGE